MKTLITFLISFGLTAQAWAAREVQNGGGGWVQDGEYMTFYSARIPVGRTPLEISEVPGLKYLIKKVLALNISEKYKSRILEQVVPASERSYYRVNVDQFDEEKRNELILKYATVMGVASETVVIFATTDPESQETFLLPDFFKLTELEQAAILFHESAWLLDPALSYERVVMLEQAAQAFFEDETSAKNIQKFYHQISLLLKDSRILLLPSLQFDLKTGALPSQLVLKEIFGEKYLKCLMAPHHAVTDLVYRSKECAQSLQSHILNLSLTYSSSWFFSALLHYLKSGHDILILRSKPSVNILNGVFTQDDFKEHNGKLNLKISDPLGSQMGIFYFL